jgi:phage shock protein PspC (stress-responsive transcriptional regulator)
MTSAPPPASPTVEQPSWQPPPDPPVRAQVRRSRSDKVIGGVSGGLAEYSGIDALLWRVGFVALALAGPGVPIYLLLWVFMPTGPEGTATAAPGQPVASTTPGPAAPRSPIPGLTIAGLLIVVGTLALISRLTGWDIGAVGYLGTALLVVGAGLVAAAFAGGRTARGGLVTLGVVLSLALAIATWSPSPDGGVGDRTYSPQTVDDVRPAYEGGVGDLTLDLSDVPLEDLDDTIVTRIDHGIGDVEVILPRSADARIRVDHGLGEVSVFGDSVDGSNFFPGSGSADWTDDGEAEFELAIHAGVGQVEVSRG